MALVLASCMVTVLAGLGTGTAGAATVGEPTVRHPGADPSTTAVENCPRSVGHYACLSVREPLRVPAVHGGSAIRPAGSSSAYGPADLASAYRLPASRSTATIAVVDAYDAPTVEADLANYRAYYHLPACTTANGCFRKVYGGSARPAPDDGWAAESALDVEMVSAICPTCHILLVEATDDSQRNLPAAVKTATNMGARYVSMSWGGPEQASQLGLDRTSLNVPGVTYIASAGDSDYGTIWPAANPTVVSVGGTSLYRDASTARGWSESVWGYTDGSGTGSGCSTYEAKPSWQRGIANSLCAHRAMNDVSIVGDPNTGVAVYLDGHWYRFGGTSAGAPMIAAMYAQAGTTTGASSVPYQRPASFNDVTDNANGYCGTALCSAGRGWDGPTGVGTPIGLSGFLALTTISVRNPGTVKNYTGTAVGINVRATDSGRLAVSYSATGLPAGTSLRSDGVIVGAPGKAGTFAVTVTARDARGAVGHLTFRWTVVNHRIATSVVPHIVGALQRGHLVTATWGTFRLDSSTGAIIHPTTRVQWYLDGAVISGAVRPTFTVPASYLHHSLKFVLSASATNDDPYRFVSPASGSVR